LKNTKQNYTKYWNKGYEVVFSKRARGVLPEMESSKAVAKLLSKLVKPNNSILDVGCGVGHYYISLKKRIKNNFGYFGIDIKSAYIREAKKIFKQETNVSFKKGSIFKIPFKAGEFDVVLFINTLENLPSIEKPISELLRVSKKYVLIRTLVDERSFYIKEVHDNNFFSKGEPKNFSFFNIYSKKYLEKIIYKYCPDCKIKFRKDRDFKSSAIRNSLKSDDKKSFFNPTNIIGKKQVNGPILMNWEFIEIFKNSK